MARIYSDAERDALATKVAKLVQQKLPQDGSVGFVLVVAARAEGNKSRFTRATNLEPLHAARLLTRAAVQTDPQGVQDVLASPNQMIEKN